MAPTTGTMAAHSPAVSLRPLRTPTSLAQTSSTASKNAHSAGDRDAGPLYKNSPTPATAAISAQVIFAWRSSTQASTSPNTMPPKVLGCPYPNISR